MALQSNIVQAQVYADSIPARDIKSNLFWNKYEILYWM